MHFFQKIIFSSSAPSSPTGGTANAANLSNNRGQSFTQRRLTRQRKLRHVTAEDLGLHFTDGFDSPPASPDSSRKPRSFCCSNRWFSSGLPQPLPLPLTKRPESLPSNFGHRSPEEGPHSVLRRLDISARSAPVSGFTSPSVSPRRTNAGELFPLCKAADSIKWSAKGTSQSVNTETVDHKLSQIATPRSAPTSSFSSPAVSPQRSCTGDFLPSFVASQASLISSAFEVPDLGRVISPLQNVDSQDCSPFGSPSSQSSFREAKSPKMFSFPWYSKLPPGICKKWPESNINFGAHPLPLPPGASPQQSFTPSPPATLLHTVEKPVSLRKTQWQKGKLIGRGTYGSVFVGTNRETGALCAMKEVDIIPDDPKSAECIKQLEQEIRLLQSVKHPNIVQYYGSEIVDDHFYIYLEYVYPGSISKYVHEHCGEMTESIVRNFTRHILSGLAYLHSMKAIHRDIKGANLLVDSSGIVKLADFGLAKHLTGLSYGLSLKGSPHWMAPEVIKSVMQNDTNPDLALAVDIWSLGCTIIEMFTGKPPWGELYGPQAMFKVLYKSPPIPEAMSPEGKDFLCCCFQRNPAERPSANWLLEHPFMQNSSELNVLAGRQALSTINLMEKSHCAGNSAAQKTDLMLTSPKSQIMNNKLPSNSQRSCAKTVNCTAISHHSPFLLEDLPLLAKAQLVYSSHNFSSSSNVSSNMPLGAVNNHPLALLRSHGREVPQI